MRKATTKDQLTQKEEELMRMLWQHGPMPVGKLVELYPDPKPHFNTVSTVIRRLEAKGFVAHDDNSGSYVYRAVKKMEDFRDRSFGDFIKGYFGGSYFGAVSALVEDEKISADELRQLLDLIDQKNKH